jgi:hypothetical protein
LLHSFVCFYFSLIPRWIEDAKGIREKTGALGSGEEEKRSKKAMDLVMGVEESV